MHFSREEGSRAIAAIVTNREIVLWLRDGRQVHTPISHSRKLAKATPAQRRKLQLLGGGMGVHWPKLDEDLLVDELVRAACSVRKVGK